MDELDVEFEEFLSLPLSNEAFLQEIERIFEQDAEFEERDLTEEEAYALALRAYSDTIGIVTDCAHVIPSNAPSSHAQAICIGSCVRISKYMQVVLSLAREHRHREVIYGLIRSILESATNIRFLVIANCDDYFDRFVKLSLGPERELYDSLIAQESRGEELDPVDQRLKDSILRFCRLSGLTIEDVSRQLRGFNIDARARMQRFNEDRMYAAFFRSPSHAIHGDWVDLLMHHLDHIDGRFAPRIESESPSPSYLTPPAYFVLEAMKEYLLKYCDETEEVRAIQDRIYKARLFCLQSDSVDREVQLNYDTGTRAE